LSATTNSSLLERPPAPIDIALLGLTPRPAEDKANPDEADRVRVKFPELFSTPLPRFNPEAGIFDKPCPEPKKADAEISFDAERLLINDEPVTCRD
jgi:hypothetical protein